MTEPQNLLFWSELTFALSFLVGGIGAISCLCSFIFIRVPEAPRCRYNERDEEIWQLHTEFEAYANMVLPLGLISIPLSIFCHYRHGNQKITMIGPSLSGRAAKEAIMSAQEQINMLAIAIFLIFNAVILLALWINYQKTFQSRLLYLIPYQFEEKKAHFRCELIEFLVLHAFVSIVTILNMSDSTIKIVMAFVACGIFCTIASLQSASFYRRFREADAELMNVAGIHH